MDIPVGNAQREASVKTHAGFLKFALRCLLLVPSAQIQRVCLKGVRSNSEVAHLGHKHKEGRENPLRLGLARTTECTLKFWMSGVMSDDHDRMQTLVIFLGCR